MVANGFPSFSIAFWLLPLSKRQIRPDLAALVDQGEASGTRRDFAKMLAVKVKQNERDSVSAGTNRHGKLESRRGNPVGSPACVYFWFRARVT